MGNQGPVPDCTAWATTYGLATFTAARKGSYAPSTATLQASPAYIYIKVMEQQGQSSTCTGSAMASYFTILDAGGTATLAQAPSETCPALWQDYGTGTLPSNPAFDVGTVAAVRADRLDGIKTVILLGGALAYGTRLYTDFPSCTGGVYVGNGHILMNKKTGKPAGHCMLIVGYDDGRGAFKIQNSWGSSRGESGFVWMAYDTFTALAQGTVAYVRP
ncbi:MAG TPA: C1 family peptidase [Longimicrobium sp.]|nr:C1 family peptidase [Longimicrobium sp.]